MGALETKRRNTCKKCASLSEFRIPESDDFFPLCVLNLCTETALILDDSTEPKCS